MQDLTPALGPAKGQKVTDFLEVSGTDVRMPVTVVCGVNDGATLLVTAGIHGGEYPERLRAHQGQHDQPPRYVLGPQLGREADRRLDARLCA
jgi:hypothetical protein